MHFDPHTAIKLAWFFLYGAVGGLIGAMAKSRRLTLPRITVEREADGELVKEWDSGFLWAPFLGGALAAIVDGRPETAIAYGLASGYAGPAIINAVVDPILKKFGLNPDSPKLPEGANR